MKTNYDKFYPDTYHRSDQLQTYVENQIENISDIVDAVERNLDKESYKYFVDELKDYINEI